METQDTHDEEILEIFRQISAEIPNSGGLRAVSEKGFSAAVNYMMNKAYFQGTVVGIREAEAAVDKVLSK